jgi:hypothetical protein
MLYVRYEETLALEKLSQLHVEGKVKGEDITEG